MRVAVFGASGTIGSDLCRELARRGHFVFAAANHIEPLKRLGEMDGRIEWALVDVLKPAHFQGKPGKLDRVVYTIGHCPPGGFAKETDRELVDRTLDDLVDEFQQHILGLHNVYQYARPRLSEDGKIIIVSSMVYALPLGKLPPALRLGHYASAKAAQAEYARWMGKEMDSSGLGVELVCPSAIKGSFHEGAPANVRAPHELDLGSVVLSLAASVEAQARPGFSRRWLFPPGMPLAHQWLIRLTNLR